jgi:drug/metabolite transporter (DMT)-like permease
MFWHNKSLNMRRFEGKNLHRGINRPLGRIAVGITLALASAAAFALQSILVRIGQRTRDSDDGHFMSVSMNAIVVLAVLPFSTFYQWSWSAFVAFLLGGIGTTWLGRGTALRAIRLIGPTRQGAFLISSPIFTGLAAWVLLEETPAPLQLLGGVLVLTGLGVLVRSKLAAEALLLEGPGAVGRDDQTRRETGSVATEDPIVSSRTRGYAIALLSAITFGLGFVARAVGLDNYPNAVVGALVGALVSLALIVGRELIRDGLGTLIHNNVRNVPLWFVAGGLLSGVGLLAGFSAFLYLPAWAVSVLKGTQGLWTLLWSYLFIREEEQLNWITLLSVTLTSGGVSVIALAS